MNSSTALDSRLLNLENHWNATQPGNAESSWKELLPLAQSLSAAGRPALIELYAHIARAEGAQGKLLEARTSLQTAEDFLAKSLEDNSISHSLKTAKLRWLLESGRLNILEKTPSQARLRLVEAWTLALQSELHDLAIEVALMMALIEPQKLQQQWIVQAIELGEGSTQIKAKHQLGNLYISLGWKRFDLHQYEGALEAFKKALVHLQTHGTRREVFVAKWSTGKLLRIMGKYEQALLQQENLLKELESEGSKDGRLFEELAECLHALKRPEEAQRYFELAYREFSGDEWVTDNQPVRLKRLKDMGKVK